jgi:hypothetical protein
MSGELFCFKARGASSQVPHIWPLALEKKQLRGEVLPAPVSGLSVLLRTLGEILAKNGTYIYQKVLMSWLGWLYRATVHRLTKVIEIK